MIPPYDQSVFINCPFDPQYRRLFYAIVYTVQECGLHPRCSLEVEDGGEERIRKVKRIIRECRYGVHDISRIQLDRRTGLPRFNMPLELGLFLGAQEYGDETQHRKRVLILDSEPYRYQRFCSDIAGQDIRVHRNQAPRVIGALRGMFATALAGVARLPGEATIRERYDLFQGDLGRECHRLHVDPGELQFVELRAIIHEWLARNPL